MSIPVYSFYEYPKVERLRDHVERALETFDENSRLVRLGRRLRKRFYEALRYAIILHDFGKIPFNQVNRVPLQQGRIKRLSFEGHEALSAWFAAKYLERAVSGGIIDPDDRRLAVLAILLHHHPMGTERRMDNLAENICIDKSTIELFYKELEGIIDPEYPVSLEGPKCGPSIVTEVYGMYGDYWGRVWINGGPDIKKAFLLLVNGLIAADYCSASLTRGAGVSEFARTIRVFLEYYGSAKVKCVWST